MRAMKRILLVWAVASAVAGCVNPGDAFRRAAQADSAAEYEGEPSYSFSTAKPADDIHDMLAEGYVLIGTIGPGSESYSNGRILEFMRGQKLERGRGYELADGTSAAGGPFAQEMMFNSSAAGFSQPLGIRSAPTPLGMMQPSVREQRTVKSLYAFFNRLREKPRFGAILKPLAEADVKAAGTRDAVKVFVVVRESPAWMAGVRDGDVVVAVNGRPFADPKDAIREIEGAEGVARLKIRRGVVTMEKGVVLGKRK